MNKIIRILFDIILINRNYQIIIKIKQIGLLIYNQDKIKVKQKMKKIVKCLKIKINKYLNIQIMIINQIFP